MAFQVDYWLLHQGSVESATQVFGILMDFVEISLPAVIKRSHIDSTSHIPPVEVRSASPNTLRSKTSFERIRPPAMPSTARAGASADNRQKRSSESFRRSRLTVSDIALGSTDASSETEIRKRGVRRKARKQKSHAKGTQVDRRRGEQGPISRPIQFRNGTADELGMLSTPTNSLLHGRIRQRFWSNQGSFLMSWRNYPISRC